MNRIEWADLVDKLNQNYPGQELRPETTTEWYETLKPYPYERVLRAIRRCRREQSFRPDPTELIAAMLANAREEPARPSGHAAIEARDPDSPGVPPPASVKMAWRRAVRGMSPDGPEPAAGRSQAQQLAELAEIIAQDQAAETGQP